MDRPKNNQPPRCAVALRSEPVTPVEEIPIQARAWAARELMADGQIDGWTALTLTVWGCACIDDDDESAYSKAWDEAYDPDA